MCCLIQGIKAKSSIAIGIMSIFTVPLIPTASVLGRQVFDNDDVVEERERECVCVCVCVWCDHVCVCTCENTRHRWMFTSSLSQVGGMIGGSIDSTGAGE